MYVRSRWAVALTVFLALAAAVSAQTGSNAVVMSGQLVRGGPQFESYNASMFEMQVEAGSTYDVAVSGDYDTFLVVRTPDGARYDNDDTASASKSRVIFSVGRSGTAQIVVRGFSQSATGSFVLEVRSPGSQSVPTVAASSDQTRATGGTTSSSSSSTSAASSAAGTAGQLQVGGDAVSVTLGAAGSASDTAVVSFSVSTQSTYRLLAYENAMSGHIFMNLFRDAALSHEIQPTTRTAGQDFHPVGGQIFARNIPLEAGTYFLQLRNEHGQPKSINVSVAQYDPRWDNER